MWSSCIKPTTMKRKQNWEQITHPQSFRWLTGESQLLCDSLVCVLKTSVAVQWWRLEACARVVWWILTRDAWAVNAVPPLMCQRLKLDQLSTEFMVSCKICLSNCEVLTSDITHPLSSGYHRLSPLRGSPRKFQVLEMIRQLRSSRKYIALDWRGWATTPQGDNWEDIFDKTCPS